MLHNLKYEYQSVEYILYVNNKVQPEVLERFPAPLFSGLFVDSETLRPR